MENIQPSERKNVQIDFTLESCENEEIKDCQDEHDDCSDEGIVDENQHSKDEQPMIEMSVALGDFDSNPVVTSLLANEDADTSCSVGEDDESSHQSDSDDNNIATSIINIASKQNFGKAESVEKRTGKSIQELEETTDTAILTIRSTKRRKTEKEKNI